MIFNENKGMPLAKPIFLMKFMVELLMAAAGT